MKNVLKIGEMVDHAPAWLKDAFVRVAKDADMKTDALELHRHTHSEKSKVNQIDASKRQSLKYVSARTQDRDDEIVIPQTINLKEFRKYMHVLVNHNYSLLPIGSDEWIEADDFGIKALTNHANTGEGTLANVIWHLVEQGHMKASSIGFVPTSFTKPGARDWDHVANQLQSNWKEFDKAKAEKSVSRIITGGVLLEHSFVSVPCNTDAEMVTIVKGMGVDVKIVKQLGLDAIVKKAETKEDESCVCGKCGLERTCAAGIPCTEEGCDGSMKPKSKEKAYDIKVVEKGDLPGHEFRGNQFSGGGGGGSDGDKGEVPGKQEELERTAQSAIDKHEAASRLYEKIKRDIRNDVPASSDRISQALSKADEAYNMLKEIERQNTNPHRAQEYKDALAEADSLRSDLEDLKEEAVGNEREKSFKAAGDGESVGSDEDGGYVADAGAVSCECSACGKKAQAIPATECKEEGCDGVMESVTKLKEKKPIEKENTALPGKSFDACVLIMTEKGHDEESAKKICGKLKEESGEKGMLKAAIKYKAATPDMSKAELVMQLKELLGCIFDFYKQAHGAHWNVTGPDFTEWHDLFGEIYADAWGSVDPLAENIRKLGQQVPALSQLEDLAPAADASTDPKALAVDLLSFNEELIDEIKDAFDIATDAGEQGIANFLADRQDVHAKWGWQLRSSLGLKGIKKATQPMEIKVVQPPMEVKVLYSPSSVEEIQKGVSDAVTLALSRRTGKIL